MNFDEELIDSKKYLMDFEHLSHGKVSRHSELRGELMANFVKTKINLKKSKVIEIGSNIGAIVVGFAKHSKKVCCGDVVDSYLKTVKKRVKKAKLKNVEVKRLDAVNLPYKDNYFDLAIINGVLEWIPTYVDGDPRELQKTALKEARRVLKKGGMLYLAIENRYFLKHFIGKAPHRETPFTTVMPRTMAHAVSKIFTGRNYRNYLYNMNGYKKLLKEAGFKKIKFYTAIPSYVWPYCIVDVNNKRAIKKCVKKYSRGKLNKIIGSGIANAGLYKNLGPNYVILAK